jgi:hypothetical protein
MVNEFETAGCKPAAVKVSCAGPVGPVIVIPSKDARPVASLVAVLPAVIEYSKPILALMVTPLCATMFPN